MNAEGSGRSWLNVIKHHFTQKPYFCNGCLWAESLYLFGTPYPRYPYYKGLFLHESPHLLPCSLIPSVAEGESYSFLHMLKDTLIFWGIFFPHFLIPSTPMTAGRVFSSLQLLSHLELLHLYGTSPAHLRHSFRDLKMNKLQVLPATNADGL